jgi:dimethylhistidine N-methyltransferase
MIASRLRLPSARPLAPSSELHRDVIRGLSSQPKELPCKHFYDAAGSQLFEEICGLPEYYLTRAELEILERNAAEIASLVGRSGLLVEFGSGASRKTRILLDHLEALAAYVPIDVATEQLEASAGALAEAYPHLDLRPVPADFTGPLNIPVHDLWYRRRIVFFPGSTIGNFCRHEAVRLLRRIARVCGEEGGLLLGADLKKDPAVIEAAYNDSRGVTAAFNLNLLERINGTLGANFQTSRFWHHAFYDAVAGRIEMQLVSQREQTARVAGRRFDFREGEPIRTEYSHKYTVPDLHELAEAAGMRIERVWLDSQRLFSVSYWTPTDRRRNGHELRLANPSGQ